MREPMTPERAKALRAAATPGPWTQWVEHGEVYAGHITVNEPARLGAMTMRLVASCQGDESQHVADAALIAAAPELVDAYLAETETLRRRVAELERECDGAETQAAVLAAQRNRLLVDIERETIRARVWQERAELRERERDEARDGLRALVAALMLDDAPRPRAINAAHALISSWGAQPGAEPAAPRPIAVGERVRVVRRGWCGSTLYEGDEGTLDQVDHSDPQHPWFIKEPVADGKWSGGWVAAVERVEPAAVPAACEHRGRCEEMRARPDGLQYVSFGDGCASCPIPRARDVLARRERERAAIEADGDTTAYPPLPQRSDVVVLDETDDHGRPA